MALFPFTVVPTILPLPKGVNDAKWEVELDSENQILGKTQSEVLNAAVSVK